MVDLTRITPLLKQTVDAVETGDRQFAEKAGLELCKVFEEDYNITGESDYTPSAAKIQYEVLLALLRLHIMRGDPMDISIRSGQILKKYKDDRKHLSAWSRDDWKEIDEIILRVVKHTDDYYYQKTLERTPKEVERTAECTCLLCRKNKADKTGSHMVPHLLIADVFTFDGSKSREKVVVESASLAGGVKERYFGHEVYDDTVNNLLGRSFSDDEIEAEQKKRNALTLDHVFCSDCEKRFSTIESYYAEIISGKLKDYPPEIPYLFWLSVAWRMSVGGMGFKMEGAHEDKLRKILNTCLTLKREDIVLKHSKLGYCGYTLHRAVDTRDETLGILAIHTPTIPYEALIGNILFRFYTSRTKAYNFEKKFHHPSSGVNCAESKEVIQDMDFIEFWLVKRSILDDNWNEERDIANLGLKRNKTLYPYEAVPEGFKDSPTYPNYLNTCNDHVMIIPRAIRNILKWTKENPQHTSLEELSAGTGYSERELSVILSYWDKKVREQEAKQKRTHELGPVLEAMLDLFE